MKELSEAELSAVAGGSTGAGAGKITFNPFVIIKVVDKSSPHLFL
jgi:bacteriocin-like protein